MAQYQPQIAELCRKHRIARLELFGSAARGDFDPQTSDLDFFVTLEDLGWKGSFKRYMGMKFDLEELFGRSIDLVEPSAVDNPYFLMVADRHRSLIYAA